MKKVLFATTALIATASVAAAEVRISGYGRFGLDWNEANENTGMGETSITSRLRLQFDMSTETDGGITFGARYRAQAESRDGTPGTGTFNGPRFFASFGGLTVAVGNIGGAVEFMQGLYLETRTADIGIDGAGFNSVVANMGQNFFDWDAYSSAGAGVNGLEVIYNAAAFGVHVSYSDSTTPAFAVGTQGETNTAIAGYYTFGDWTVALAYNDEEVGTGLGVNADNDLTVFTVSGDLGFAGVRLAYANMDNLTSTATAGGTVTQDVSKVGLYGTFDIGAATTLVAYVTSEDNPGGVSDGTGYGINVSYDLGGGVSFEAGARETSSDNTTVQAGVYFSF